MLAAVSAKLSLGSCPDTEYMQNIDKTRYVGHWFEQVHDMLNPYSISSDCVSKEFQLDENEDIALHFRAYYYLMLNYVGVDGVMYQCDEDLDEGTCMATMAGKPHRVPFKIFDTDYETYDIFYDCKDIAGGMMKNEMFSVYTREVDPSDETLEAIKKRVAEKLPQYDLDTAWGLVTPSHDKCVYKWEFEGDDMSEEVLY